MSSDPVAEVETSGSPTGPAKGNVQLAQAEEETDGKGCCIRGWMPVARYRLVVC